MVLCVDTYVGCKCFPILYMSFICKKFRRFILAYHFYRIILNELLNVKIYLFSFNMSDMCTMTLVD